MKTGLQKELDLWTAGQKEWKTAAPRADRKFIPGNHEDRLRRYLWKAGEISDLESMQLPSLLGFVNLGIQWDGKDYTTSEVNLFDKLVVRHGKYVRQGSAMSAKAELEAEKYSISTLSGHTHRGGTHYARTRKGIVQSHEGFCLCRLNPEYVSRPNWQQGIVLASVTSGTLSVESVLIFELRGKKTAIWREKTYTS